MVKSKLEDQTQALLAQLHELRAEIRLRIHLGEIEQRVILRDLEARISEAERGTAYATVNALEMLRDLNAKWELLRENLSGPCVGRSPSLS